MAMGARISIDYRLYIDDIITRLNGTYIFSIHISSSVNQYVDELFTISLSCQNQWGHAILYQRIDNINAIIV